MKPVTCYYSPGTDPQFNADLLEEYLGELYADVPIAIEEVEDYLLIEDDDNVLQMAQKVEIMTRYRRDFLYFYIASDQEHAAVNMCFDLSYMGGNKELRKFVYNVEPSKSFGEQFENSAAWEKRVEKHDFISSILSKFYYPDPFNIINCVSLDQYIALLGQNPNGFLLRTYYSVMNGSNQNIVTAIVEDNDLHHIMHGEGGKEYESILSKLKQSSLAIRAINDRETLQYAEEMEPEEGTKLVFGSCNISEAIVHINYDEQNEHFVDLGKIFHMFQMSEMIPFIRFKSERDKVPKYKVYAPLTDKTSPLYVEKTTLLDWTNTKYKKRIDNTDTHAISAQVLTKNASSARGLSFKIYNYGEGPDRKYITANVYKDGKIEIKCSWEEKSVGTAALVAEALGKVTNFIEEINKLQYYTNGAKKRKITLPTTQNTHIAFFNTITTIDLGIPLDYDTFWEHMNHFTSAYITRVARRGISGPDKRSVEMRYKRVHNYIQLKGVHRFIKSYKDSKAAQDPKGAQGEYKLELIKEIANIFNFTEEDSRKVLDQYEKEQEGKQKRVKGQPKPLGKDEIGKRIGRSMIKQPGIDIKIIKKDFDKKNDHQYKCLILGITEDMLGSIFNFVRSLVYYYRYNDVLSQANGDYEILLGNKLDVPESDEEEGDLANKEQAIHAKLEAMKEPPAEDDIDLEGMDLDNLDLGFDLGIGAIDGMQMDQAPEAVDLSVQSIKAPKKVVIKKMGMLEIMKAIDPELVGTGKAKVAGTQPYSRSCQKSDYRQPLVIRKKTRDALKTYIAAEKARITAALAEGGPDADLSAHLDELNVHAKTIDSGAEYRGNFFFCPLTWDYMNDNEGATIKLPRLEEAMKSSNYYYPSSNSWLANTYASWEKKKKLSGPPHPWFLSFVENIGTPEAGNCAPCCFKTSSSRATMRREACLGGETKIGAKVGDYAYIKAQNKPMEEKRYGFIPDKLNRIFNRTDDNLKLKDGKITAGFSHYLRRGVSSRGNFFMNCLNELMPSEKNLIGRIIDWLQQRDPDMTVYKSLKKGALFHLFMPSSDDSQDDVNMALADSSVSRDRFITYLKEKAAEINEDFLWDLVSYPGVIMEQGLNVVICDVKFTKKKNNQVEFGKIKCPVGFDYNTLYDIERPTIVLYKYYGTRYEIICHVEAGENRDIHAQLLFPVGDSLVTNILERIKGQCIPIANLTAVQELNRHVNNVTKKASVFDNVFLENIVPIDLHTAIAKLTAMRVDNPVTSKYVPKLQIVDSYTKVTHLVLENGMWVPVLPSGVIDGIPFKKWTEVDLPSYRDVVHGCMQLHVYANFGDGYTPVAFLLDPGEDLDDPSDDIIIGVLLKSGLITFTDVSGQYGSSLVRDLTDDNAMLPIEDLIKADADGMDGEPNIPMVEPFNLKELLFAESEREAVWYDDYKKADEELMKAEKDSKDLRLIYAVRSDFEHESYHKFRYEFSKILVYQGQEHIDYIDSILKAEPEEDVEPHKQFDEKRMMLMPEITKLMIDHVTSEPTEGILQAVGPVDIGYDDLINDADLIAQYKFNYVRLNIRYSCTDPKLAEYRQADIHCIVSGEEESDKLFVPPVNLLTGAGNNFENYVARLVEELIRIPLKRSEIMTDQVDNFVTDIHVMRDSEHYLDSEDLFEDIRKIYETGIDYQRRMREHYDVVNPAGYIEPDDDNVLAVGMGIASSDECTGSYVNLPKFWIQKLKTMSFKIYHVEGSHKCIYKVIDDAILSLSKNQGKFIDTRSAIANIVGNSMVDMGDDDYSFDDYEEREGWQLARDFYAHMWRQDYRNINTKEELLDMIMVSDRHHISFLDLSLISRAFDVRFIILNKPTTRAPTGISCLGTTQSKSGNYIILYLQGLDNYNIVVNTKFSPPKKIFTEAELADPAFGAKAIFDVWLDYCGNDTKEHLDPANFLFRSAPIQSRNDETGRVQFTDKDGNVLPQPAIKPVAILKAKLKAKAKPKADADVGADADAVDDADIPAPVKIVKPIPRAKAHAKPPAPPAPPAMPLPAVLPIARPKAKIVGKIKPPVNLLAQFLPVVPDAVEPVDAVMPPALPKPGIKIKAKLNPIKPKSPKPLSPPPEVKPPVPKIRAKLKTNVKPISN